MQPSVLTFSDCSSTVAAIFSNHADYLLGNGIESSGWPFGSDASLSSLEMGFLEL